MKLGRVPATTAIFKFWRLLLVMRYMSSAVAYGSKICLWEKLRAPSTCGRAQQRRGRGTLTGYGSIDGLRVVFPCGRSSPLRLWPEGLWNIRSDRGFGTEEMTAAIFQTVVLLKGMCCPELTFASNASFALSLSIQD